MSETNESPLFAMLRERLRVPEDLELEFKAAKGGLPKSLWPTISAFANTIGGWIILGIDDQAHFEVSGIDDPNKLLQDFYNQMRNPQKIRPVVCGPTDASIESIDGKAVIVIRVPAASRRDRPVYVNGHPYDGTYVRAHSGDYRCSKPEVDRMMREASDQSSDATILPHFTIDDLDRATLTSYRQRFQTRNLEHTWTGYDDRRFLQAIGAYARDRTTGDTGLTVAGLLLLGTESAIREWRSRHLIDYRQTPGEANLDQRWIDRIAWEGNLLGAFEAVYPRLVKDLPQPFQLRGQTRVDRSPIHEVLREAFVNLLVHADYAETDASLVVRFPEGFAFRNPGNSRVPVADLISGDRSDPRNPNLVRMFRLIGFAEEAGSGMASIIRAWRELGFQLPLIDVGTERYEFSLVLRHAHFLSEEDRNWLQRLGTEWSEAEQLALVSARHADTVDNPTLRRLTGLHSADVTRVLRGLRDRGLFRVFGSGPATRYELTDTALSALTVTSDATSEQLGLPLTNSDSSGASSDSNDFSSDSNDFSSDSSGASSDSNDFSSDSSDVHAMNVQQRLENIARPMRERRRLSSSQRADIIAELCAVRPLGIRELESLLDRKPETLRQPLRALMTAGRLRLLYPDRPSHPDQKYLTVQTDRDGSQAGNDHADRTSSPHPHALDSSYEQRQ